MDDPLRFSGRQTEWMGGDTRITTLAFYDPWRRKRTQDSRKRKKAALSIGDILHMAMFSWIPLGVQSKKKLACKWVRRLAYEGDDCKPQSEGLPKDSAPSSHPHRFDKIRDECRKERKKTRIPSVYNFWWIWWSKTSRFLFSVIGHRGSFSSSFVRIKHSCERSSILVRLPYLGCSFRNWADFGWV